MIQTTEPAAQSLMYITDRPPVVMVRGAGSWLWDHSGRKYLDFIQGWAVNCLGHSPRMVVDAIKAQAERLLNPSPAYYNQPMIELADMLVEHGSFEKVFFANSGAEANEGAIKLARKWGHFYRDGAYEIITMEHSFHGRTLAMMSASGKPQFRTLFEPKVPGFPKAHLNDLESVRNLIRPTTVAVMLEPIQGESGVHVASDDFLRGLRDLTRQTGILLIVDEVQTGMARTGRLFAHQHAEIEPDIMTLGKGIGGGVPLAALLARKEICCFAPGDQGGTYNGNPLMTAAGCAVMREIATDEFLRQAQETGAYLAERLRDLSHRLHLGQVRGRGLLMALDLEGEIAKSVAVEAMGEGLLINAPRPGTLRFMPALNVSADEIDQMIDILSRVLGRVLR